MSDREAIDRVLNNFVTAFNKGDVAACLASLADDVLVMPPNAPAISGRQPYGAWIEGLLEVVSIEETISEHHTEIAGDWAFDSGHWEATITQRADDQQFEDRGDYVWVLRKAADGSWATVQMIWNSDNPLAEQ